MADLDTWPHLFVPGSDSGPVALTLHGTGGSEHDSVQLAELLLPGQPVLSPRGRVSEQGMNRWFRRAAEGVFDVDDVIARSAELAEFIAQATHHYGVHDREVIALGFSNGANIAQATALLHPDTLTTVVAFSGMYPFGDRDPVGNATGVTIFSSGGENDPMAPAASADHLVTVAHSHGAAVTRVVRPGGHGITAEEIDQASAWLASVLEG
jgi:phospholipase/carboxylesterase